MFTTISDFYAEIRPDPAQALFWARKDISRRDNHATQAALARAYLLAGDVPQAVLFIERALSSGVQETDLFSHAADIFRAAGRDEESKHFAGQGRRNQSLSR